MPTIMASQLLSLAGDIVKSINLSLLSSPPPDTEESGNDVCYLGRNGEDDNQHVVFCRDLPDGQRGMVGSWYIHPERHVIEYIAFVAISSIIIRRILPTLSQYPNKKANDLNPPLFIKIVTFFFFTCQLVYKITGYPKKFLFMVMPCNVLWTMWALCCCCPLKAQTMHIMYQLMIPYTFLALVAIATPDTADLKMWMEVPFFFVMHVVLIAYPIYFLRSGRISVLSLSDGIVVHFLKYWSLACAYFALFYFGVVTPVSMISGINLNYMLSPPPAPGNILDGPNFRLLSTLCCAAAFFFVQFVATASAVFTRAGSKAPMSVSKKSV